MASDLPSPPSRRWYRAAALLVVAGLVAAGAWWPYATTRVFDAVETFERTGPFGGAIELDEVGTHTFWIEGPCLSCHDNQPSEYRTAATVAVIDPVGRDLELRPAAARFYNTARREGRSLWLFDVRTPGTHTLSLDFDRTGDWDNTPPGNVAISSGNGLPVEIVRPMFELIIGGALAGAVVATVTYTRRRRYYQRSAELTTTSG